MNDFERINLIMQEQLPDELVEIHMQSVLPENEITAQYFLLDQLPVDDYEPAPIDLPVDELSEQEPDVNEVPETEPVTKLTQKKPSPCKVCGKVLSSAYCLKVHLKTHLGLKPFQCEICDKRLTRKDHLKKHLANVHGEGTPTVSTLSSNSSCKVCKLCKREIPESRFDKHLQYHARFKPFRCSYCGQRYKMETSLKSHITKNHKNNEGEPKTVDYNSETDVAQNCSSPPASDDSISLTDNGSNLEQATPESVPVLQNQILPDSESQTQPQNSKNKICSICQWNCKTEADLLTHLQTHANKPLLKCRICNKCFKTKYNLQGHMSNIHGIERSSRVGKKRFACNGCQVKFYHEKILKQHIEKNESCRKFVCRFCPRRCYDNLEFEIHQLLHTNLPPVSAPVAEPFSASYLLKNQISMSVADEDASTPEESYVLMAL